MSTRITFILATDAVGGTESQVITLVKNLQSYERVNIWLLDGTSEISNLTNQLMLCKNVHFFKSKNIDTIFELSRLTDVIYSCIINYYWPEIILKLLSNAKLITARRNLYHWREKNISLPLNEYARNLLTAEVVCNSLTVKKKVESVERFLPKTTTIYNGFELSADYVVPRHIRKKFICVANIKVGKGYDKVASLVHRDILHFSDLKIYGRVDDTQLASQLPGASLQGLRDKNEIYSDNCFLLHLSDSEGFPNVVIEALEAGIMPILSPLDVHIELFEDVAIIVSAAMPISEIINSIYSDDTDFTAIISERLARYSVDRDLYSIENMVKKYKEIFAK